MKKRKNIYMIVAIILSIVIIVVGCFNMKNSDFWNITVAQVFTLLVAIWIAFAATQFKNDERKTKEQVEKVISKLQCTITDPKLVCINQSMNDAENETTKKQLTMSIRKIKNCISILKEYGKSLGFEKEIQYIDNEFGHYNDTISNKISDFDYLSKSESILRKYIENIDSKCDEIVLMLYN